MKKSEIIKEVMALGVPPATAYRHMQQGSCHLTYRKSPGKSKHPLYQLWKGMKQRCSNPAHLAFRNYGGRGISVCTPWVNSFESFLKDMGETWRPGLTLDRIDNDKGYEPDNCRWADRETQAGNRRGFGLSKFKGVSMSQGFWVSRYRGLGSTIYLGQFETEVEAAHAYDQFVINAGVDSLLNFPRLTNG